MDQAQFDALEDRIRIRAERMWQEAGSPDGGVESYLDDAREMVAMGEVRLPGDDPYEVDPVEEASLQGNLGEFPTLRDQGDERLFPDDHDIRLSDGDASDQGGVQPGEDLPERKLPDVPHDADAGAGTGVQGGNDLPDAGLPDLPPMRPARR